MQTTTLTQPPTATPRAPRHYAVAELERLITHATSTEASDLHLRAGTRPRMRRALEVRPVGDAPITDASVGAFFDHLLAKRPCTDALKERLMNGGWADFSFTAGDTVARGSVFQETDGLALALRFFYKKHVDLGFLGLQHLTQFTNWQSGLVLLTGSTGSGKTTVGSALAEHINRTQAVHIATLEDPVEYRLSEGRAYTTQRGIPNQVSSFADGLKSILRQDPDVILVGEIRDLDTLKTVLSAAESGHLVISTIHAGSVVDAMQRLLGMFPSDQQASVRSRLASMNLAVVNQALVPGRSGNLVVAHELFHSCESSYATVRDGEWSHLQNLQLCTASMRLWDKELARMVTAGLVTEGTALSYVRDQSVFRNVR